jgi:hypothetical protein
MELYDIASFGLKVSAYIVKPGVRLWDLEPEI